MPAVNEYLKRFPDSQEARLQELRELIVEVLPEAKEEIKWGAPAYSTGTVLVTFAGFANHLNLYLTPSTIAAFQDVLSECRTGKSSVSLPYDKQLPRDLIADLLRFRREEYEHDGITWR